MIEREHKSREVWDALRTAGYSERDIDSLSTAMLIRHLDSDRDRWRNISRHQRDGHARAIVELVNATGEVEAFPAEDNKTLLTCRQRYNPHHDPVVSSD